MREASAKLHALLTLWNKQRRNRPLPSRLDFTPMDLRPWIGNIALVDIRINDGAVFRLCGTNLFPRFGGERTGQRVAELDDDIGGAFRFAIQQVLHTRRPFLAMHDGSGSRPRQFLELCMPLSDTGLHIGTLMFASYPVNQPIANAPAMRLEGWTHCDISTVTPTAALS
jgi:hypothetical protein